MTRIVLLVALAAILAGPTVAGWATGTRLVVVDGGSMAPTYAWGDLITINTHQRELRPGAVVAVRRPTGVLYTHRIITVNPDGTAITQGDANSIPDDPPITASDLIGTATAHIPSPWAQLLTAAQSWPGRISLALVGLGLTILPSLHQPRTPEPHSSIPAQTEPT